MPKFFNLPVSANTTQPFAYVYVWSGEAVHNIGHVAIQINENNTQNYSRTYLSLWPKSFPAIGPMAIFPLKATLATTLGEDEQAECAAVTAHSLDHAMEGTGVSLDPHADLALQPDKIFKIAGLDHKKIQEEVKRLKEGIQTGKVCYQLFPQVNMMRTMQRFFKYSADNPFTQQIESHQAITLTAPEVYNCSTMVQHLLLVGGMYHLPSQPIWRPAQLATELEETSIRWRNRINKDHP